MLSEWIQRRSCRDRNIDASSTRANRRLVVDLAVASFVSELFCTYSLFRSLICSPSDGDNNDLAHLLNHVRPVARRPSLIPDGNAHAIGFFPTPHSPIALVHSRWQFAQLPSGLRFSELLPCLPLAHAVATSSRRSAHFRSCDRTDATTRLKCLVLPEKAKNVLPYGTSVAQSLALSGRTKR